MRKIFRPLAAGAALLAAGTANAQGNKITVATGGKNHRLSAAADRLIPR
jgi:hypothetical protein